MPNQLSLCTFGLFGKSFLFLFMCRFLLLLLFFVVVFFVLFSVFCFIGR